MRAKIAMVPYDRVQGIAEGECGIDGLELDVSLLPPSEIFYRMLHEDAFDISEMSLSSTFVHKLRGRDWVVLPIFPFRSLFHTGFLVRSGIESPEQLKGGRIGLVEYQVTAALWGRGVLAEDFGVEPEDVTWYVERSGELSHSHAGGITAPDDVRVEPVDPGSSMGEMLLAGELDAILPSPLPGISNRFNRTHERDMLAHEGVERLFRDPLAEARRYLAQHGFLHINHTVVVRGELVRKRPSLPRELMAMFEESKQLAYRSRDRLRLSVLLMSHLHLDQQDEEFGSDPFPYGMAANVDAVRAAMRRSLADGFIDRELELDELFAKELLDT